MTKPWEERWVTSGVDVLLANQRMFVCMRSSDAPHDDGSDHLRSDLAAAAPDLYRALADIEWVDAETGSAWRGELQRHQQLRCPVCGGSGPRLDSRQDAASLGWREVQVAGQHINRCSLEATLRKARGER